MTPSRDSRDSGPSNEGTPGETSRGAFETMIGPEKLAAALDGRLDPRERAALLAQLSASDTGREVYADAIAVLRELDAAEPIRLHRVAPLRWLAVAAAVVLMAGIPLVLMLTTLQRPGDPGRFAALIVARQELPAGFELRPWTVGRAGEAALTPDARAARIGARITDLELAAASGDTTARAIAAEIAALLQDVPAGGAVANIFRGIAAQATSSGENLSSDLSQGGTSAARLLGAELVELAAWVQAGRVAATRGDAAFISRPASRAVLLRASRSKTLSGNARAVILNLQLSATNETAPDPERVERDLTQLLQLLAR